MKPRTRPVLQLAVEAGVTAGVRQAWKHTDDSWPTVNQQEMIAESVMAAIDEWFLMEEAE